MNWETYKGLNEKEIAYFNFKFNKRLKTLVYVCVFTIYVIIIVTLFPISIALLSTQGGLFSYSATLFTELFVTLVRGSIPIFTTFIIIDLMLYISNGYNGKKWLEERMKEKEVKNDDC